MCAWCACCDRVACPRPRAACARCAAADGDRRDEHAHLVDLAGVEERPGQPRAALEQHALDAERAELVERVGRRARASLPPGGHDDLGAGGPQRLDAASGRRHATSTTISAHLGRGARELAVERQARLGVEHDPRGLARDLAACARSAADRPRARSRCRCRPRRPPPRQRCTSRRLSSSEIHFESPVWVATLPSRLIADLNITCGRPVRACLRNGWFMQPGSMRHVAVDDLDVDPLVAQDPEPAPRGLVGGVVGGHHHAPDPGAHDRVRAGWRAGPWWQHGSSVTYIVAPIGSAAQALERGHLRVVAAVGGVVALAEHLVVARDDRAHERVRARVARGRAPRARSPFACDASLVPSRIRFSRRSRLTPGAQRCRATRRTIGGPKVDSCLTLRQPTRGRCAAHARATGRPRPSGQAARKPAGSWSKLQSKLKSTGPSPAPYGSTRYTTARRGARARGSSGSRAAPRAGDPQARARTASIRPSPSSSRRAA